MKHFDGLSQVWGTQANDKISSIKDSGGKSRVPKSFAKLESAEDLVDIPSTSSVGKSVGIVKCSYRQTICPKVKERSILGRVSGSAKYIKGSIKLKHTCRSISPCS